ncbi:hypothetical protein BZG36_04078 [Bifiguratus adelaidae]|uniref:RWD domain-containing protein n=1 Tax=Bifiguratus adelaidae TaxID=1938954 RepID=A0A261XXY0_9FUNG|nr:hypothetical protein BZG36_04078 [Bifiguratus adelaidae]
MTGKEEQQNELEALQSIYPDEFEELDPNEFRIRVNPEEESEDYPFVLSLKVTYTPTYPDELPDFSVEVIQGDVPPTAMDRFKSELTRVGEESLGMAMCFALASALKEELEALILRLRKERDDEREERLRKELEAEQEKFRGTRVTRQKFLDWKKAFDKEMAEKEVAERGRIKVVAGKLTGRQLFEQDKSLASSDATYMEEGDDSVDVSLFEKEDIELSDEEEDDNAVWKSFKGED